MCVVCLCLVYFFCNITSKFFIVGMFATFLTNLMDMFLFFS